MRTRYEHNAAESAHDRVAGDFDAIKKHLESIPTETVSALLRGDGDEIYAFLEEYAAQVVAAERLRLKLSDARERAATAVARARAARDWSSSESRNAADATLAACRQTLELLS